ncbi:hypothetical protein K1719_038913 [Acacia pycnantha]|nr:hypothetical protein K1719_038913 [Acacia pycnantha]
MDDVLAKGEKVNFFHDEFRCPIYVKDLVTIVLALTSQWIPEGNQMQLVLNAGGPDRVSRVQMPEAVAQFKGKRGGSLQEREEHNLEKKVMMKKGRGADRFPHSA